MMTPPAQQAVRAAGVRLQGASDRWRPCRAGVIQVWQYGEEILEFHGGRLLLFGANGSGKTMLLELLLPYLLDARGTAGRLSTAGADRGGLWDRMTGYSTGQGRTGYLWIEFVRVPPDGTSTYFTCGARLRAKPGGGGDSAWFTTSRRVGHDLSLLDAQRRPLPVQELAEALGSDGRVHNRDTDAYRTAVRTTLYPELTREQFAALLDTLLVVRRRSVTESLTGKGTSDRKAAQALHRLLSQALPALDEQEVAKVAQGFEDLDRRRSAIEQQTDDIGIVERLLRRVRSYSRTVLGALAKRVSEAETARDNVTRDERAAGERIASIEAQLDDLAARLEAIEEESIDVGAQREAAMKSDAYRSAGALDALRNHVTDLAKADELAQEHAQTDRGDADEAFRAAAKAATRAEEWATRLGEAISRLRAHLLAATLGGLVADSDSTAVADGLPTVTLALHDRAERIREMRGLLDRHRQAVDARAAAEEARDGADAARRQAGEALRAAEEALDGTVMRWSAAVTTWSAGLAVLPVQVDVDSTDETTPEALIARVTAAVTDAREAVVEMLQRELSQIDAQRTAITTERDALDQERAQLEAGVDRPPDAPPDRRDRQAASGAALWELTDFATHTDAPGRDLLEAALADAGLLDAWVTPDGTVALPDGQVDRIIAVGRPAPSTSLADALTAVDHDAVPAHVTRAVLTGVALLPSALPADLEGSELPADRHRPDPDSDGTPGHEPNGDRTIAVGRDGTWLLGNLSGRAAARPARHIGAAARAAARRRRLDDIAARLGDLDRTEGALDRTADEVATRRRAAVAEARRCPDPAPIRDAQRTVSVATAREADAVGHLEDMTQALETASAAVSARWHEVTRLAAQSHLPTTAADLHAVATAVERAKESATDIRHAVDRERSERNAADREAARTATLRKRAAASEAQASESARALRKERTKLEELERTAGTDAARVVAHVDALTRRGRELDRQHRAIQQEANTGRQELVAAQVTRETIADRRTLAEQARSTAHEALHAALADGLGAIAGTQAVDAPTTATATLDQARYLLRDLERVRTDTTTLRNRYSAVHEEIHHAAQQLAGRVEVAFVQGRGDHSVLTTQTDNMAFTGVELRDRLTRQLDLARSELTAAEEQVFERALTGSLRQHLASRLRLATAMVNAMNDVLSQVRTQAGGVGVTLRWTIDGDVDDPATLRRVRTLLLGSTHTVTEREELFAFLRRQIERVRADDSDLGSWHERLSTILDYRAWHRFSIRVHHARFGEHGAVFGSQRASLSTGERAVMLTLPLIAAVVAHYLPSDGGAGSRCPRLLLMDELFPTLDAANKRQLLGLLPALDLDAVFTSDKDWCDYDTLDAIAIHVVQKDAEQSFTTRFTWDGLHRNAAPVRMAASPDGDLFGDALLR